MKNIKKRMYVYAFCFFIALFLVITKLFFLQILNRDFKGNNTLDKRQYTKNIKAKRGSIITSDNFEIALDLEYQNFVIDPTLFESEEDREIFLNILVEEIPDLDKNEIRETIIEKRNKDSKYYPFEDVLITTLQKENIEKKLREHRIKKGVVSFNRVFKRNYVDNPIFENIVGYLNKEDKGVYGLENRYEDILKGEDGLVTGTRPFSPYSAEYTLPYLIDKKVVKEEQPGNNLRLTINSILQYSLDNILLKSFEEYSPVSAMGIVMESDTGKIIAMSSYPKADDKANVKNLNITDLFEPGSIFKPITVAAAINEGKINENTLINSDGYIRVRNRIVRDHDNTTKGIMPVSKIVAHSGNVGLVKISQMLEPETFYKYLENFGLNDKTGIDVSYETSAKLMGFKNFSEVRRSNVSFGQGINMTQLQMLVALNSTINGGNIIKPYVVEKILDRDNNVIEEFKPQIVKKVISENTSAKIRKILEGVVSSGTGRGIKIDGYKIGGKTGTAQKAGPNGYERGKYFSSFFAFFPADKPKYSILITVNEPHGAYYGATVALPMAKDILDKMIKYYNITPTEAINNVENEEEVIVRENKNKKIDSINHDISLGLMPNVIGITRKNIMQLNFGKYKLDISGSGKVIRQYPEEGSVLKEGMKIKLELE